MEKKITFGFFAGIHGQPEEHPELYWSSGKDEMLPGQKLTVVREMEQDRGVIAMIADGVNDPPALAAATVGVAMGAGGTAVALETADVVLMGDDLGKLSFAIGLSRASARIIRQDGTKPPQH